MSQVRRQMRNTRTSHAIKIRGELVNIAFAKITYRCAECLGELKRRNAGLVCASDDSHRGFIKRAEAERLQQEHQQQLAEIEAVYEIIDGQIVVKECE